MEIAADNLEFEEAIRLRTKIKELEKEIFNIISWDKEDLKELL